MMVKHKNDCGIHRNSIGVCTCGASAKHRAARADVEACKERVCEAAMSVKTFDEFDTGAMCGVIAEIEEAVDALIAAQAKLKALKEMA